MKFSPPKALIKVRVMLSQSETQSREEEDRHLRVEVEDCGVGMHPHEVKQLFGEMVQFDPSKLQAGILFGTIDLPVTISSSHYFRIIPIVVKEEGAGSVSTSRKESSTCMTARLGC